jgi:hypothetical protein
MTFAQRVSQQYPSLNSISYVVGWAFMYAPKERPLDDSHPLWAQFFAHSEWFRIMIADQLKLPLDIKWEEIYRRAGIAVDSEYATTEEAEAARLFGEKTCIYADIAPAMLQSLDEIKFRITGRL